MDSLSFTYPPIFLLLCILLGVAFAVLHYYKSKAFREQPLVYRISMAVLRAIGVSITAALLLGMVIKQQRQITQNPVIAIFQDNSGSISATVDSNNLDALAASFRTLEERMASGTDVDMYLFGEDVRSGSDADYSDLSTNINEAYQFMFDQYDGRNLAGVIIATDGLRNEGGNPLYSDKILSAPLYAIALGDTAIQKDIALKAIYANEIGYLGDRMAIQVDIQANNFNGETAYLNLYKFSEEGRQRIEQRRIPISGNELYQSESFIVELDEAGIQRFQFTINPLEDEAFKVNNVRDAYIEVLDAKQKILVLADAPHPDLAALKAVIESNKNKEADVLMAKDFNANINDYDLIILHQLPSRKHNIRQITDRANAENISILYISGRQSNLVALNRQQDIIKITGNRNQYNETQAVIREAFNLFTLSEDMDQRLGVFPPMTSPFGEYEISPNAEVIAWQKIGNVTTEYPLIAVKDESGQKTGIIAGTGIWRWRLFNYAQYENFETVDELFGKLINYLTLKTDKRRFRVDQADNAYAENEPIKFTAEYYNASFELVNNPDASMVIRDSDGNRYDFGFSKNGNGYDLNAGIFEAGNYSWTATLKDGTESFEARGAFTVQPLQLELYETTADHGLLYQLTKKQNGRVYYPGQIDQLIDEISESPDLKPTFYTTTRNSPVLNLKWLLAVIILVFSAEWLIRKLLGAY